jgi:hypothetical protein
MHYHRSNPDRSKPTQGVDRSLHHEHKGAGLASLVRTGPCFSVVAEMWAFKS